MTYPEGFDREVRVMKVLVGEEPTYADTDAAEQEWHQHAPPSPYTVDKKEGTHIYQNFHYACKQEPR